MMWKKRKDEDTPIERSPAPASRTGGTQQRPAEAPAPPAAPTLTKAGTTVGKSVVIKGDINSQEDIFLDGTMEGTMELSSNRLTVGKNGKVQARIKAREVEVLGTVHGDIVAGEKIIIRKAANLVGDLKSATISIEDGAYFKGSIDIVRQAPTKPPVSAVSPVAPPTAENAPKYKNPQPAGPPQPKK